MLMAMFDFERGHVKNCKLILVGLSNPTKRD